MGEGWDWGRRRKIGKDGGGWGLGKDGRRKVKKNEGGWGLKNEEEGKERWGRVGIGESGGR